MRTEVITTTALRQEKRKLTREELIAWQEERRACYREVNNLPSEPVVQSAPVLLAPQISERLLDGKLNPSYIKQCEERNRLNYKSLAVPFRKLHKDVLKVPKQKSLWKLARLARASQRLKNVKDICERFWEKVQDWRTYSEHALEIVNYFFWAAIKGLPSIHFTYKHIAQKIGICEKTVQRVTDHLDLMGIVTKEVRFKKSNLYTVNNLIFNKQFVVFFAAFFPALSHAVVSLNPAFDELSTRGVQLTNNFSYKPTVNSTTGIINTTKKGYQQQPVANNFKEKKERYRMKEERVALLNKLQEGQNVNPFSPVIEQMTAIKLTLAGKCDLSEFPDAALLHAVEILKRRQGISNPYAFVRSHAMAYCREMNLPVDWQWKKGLKNVYAIPENAPCFMVSTRLPSASGELPSADFRRASGINREENNYSQKGEIAAPLACKKCRSTRHTTQEHSKMYPLPKPREVYTSSLSDSDKAPAATPLSAPPPQTTRQYTTYGGMKVLQLTDQEANERRLAFISRPQIAQEIEKYSQLFGEKAAKEYFNRTYANLKYVVLEDE